MTMEQALAQVPGATMRMLSPCVPALTQIAADIGEGILALLCATDMGHARALVITATRLIEVTAGGGMQVLPYSETEHIQFASGGRKRLVGVPVPGSLIVHSRDGGKYTYMLARDDDNWEWRARAGTAAEHAFQWYRLRHT